MRPLNVEMELYGCFDVRIREGTKLYRGDLHELGEDSEGPKTVVVHIHVPEMRRSLYCCQFRDDKIGKLVYAFNHTVDEGTFEFSCSLGHKFVLQEDENEGFWMQVENVSVWLDDMAFDDLAKKVNRIAKELGIEEKEVYE